MTVIVNGISSDYGKTVSNNPYFPGHIPSISVRFDVPTGVWSQGAATYTFYLSEGMSLVTGTESSSYSGSGGMFSNIPFPPSLEKINDAAGSSITAVLTCTGSSTDYNYLELISARLTLEPDTGGSGGGRGNPVHGCTNPAATNYNPAATVDDGSCIIPIRGCTNPVATNYNPQATIDDGSCVFPTSGGGGSSGGGTGDGGSAGSGPTDTYTLTLTEPLSCPPRSYGGNRFPDWEQNRFGIDWGPKWIPGCRRGTEDTNLSKLIRSFQAALSLPRQRLIDFGTTDSLTWPLLESESPFWVSAQTTSAITEGLFLDDETLAVPSPVTSERFWGENSGPRLLIDGTTIYARHLESRVHSAINNLTGLSGTNPWLRRNPTTGFPYYGAWVKPWFYSDDPLNIPQVSEGDVFDLVLDIGTPQSAVISSSLYGTKVLERKYPADFPLLARGAPSRSLIPFDPLSLLSQETLAARLLRINALLSLQTAPIYVRLSAMFGRVSLTAETEPTSGFWTVNEPPINTNTIQFSPISTGNLYADIPLESRTPSRFFGGSTDSPPPQSLLSPFRTSGLPGIDRTLFVYPSNGTIIDEQSIEASVLVGSIPTTLEGARLSPLPGNGPYLSAACALPVSVVTPTDAAERGDSLRSPGDGRLLGFSKTPSAKWSSPIPSGRSVPLDLLPDVTPSSHPVYSDSIRRFL